MALGTQVPWTDPGGTPCCCEDECFTDLANEPKPIYVENTYQSATSADYSALFAGGTYTADVSVDVTAMRESYIIGSGIEQSTEQHVLDASGILLEPTTSAVEQCYLLMQSEPLTIERTSINAGINIPSTSTYTERIRFARSLGTSNGRKISIAGVYAPTSPSTYLDLLILRDLREFVFPVTISLRAGNVIDTIPIPAGFPPTACGIAPDLQGQSGIPFPSLPQVTTSLSLSVSGGDVYTATTAAHPCFFASINWQQVIDGEGQFVTIGGQTYGPLFGSVTGSMSLDVTFIPSAP